MTGLRKRVFSKNLYILLAAICLFFLAYVINRYIVDSTATRYYAQRIERRIQDHEKDFKEFARNTTLINALVQKTYSEAALDQVLFSHKEYGIFIVEKDSATTGRLLFWNTQKVAPPVNLLDDDDGSHLIKLDNGWYVYRSEVVELDDDRVVTVEALIPVMWKYFMENENLHKGFVDFPSASRWVDLSFDPTPYTIKSVEGNVLCYLQKLNVNEHKNNYWVISLTLLGFFLFFVYLHQVAHMVAEKKGLWTGVGVLASVLILVRLLTYLYPDLLNLGQFELFSPAIYSSGVVLQSFGDLLINVILFCWIVLFISRRISMAKFEVFKEVWLNWIVITGLMTMLVAATFTFSNILQSMVADARVSFNVTNISNLTTYSFIGFLILATLALSYFFLSQILLNVANQYGAGDHNYYLYIVAASIGLLILSFTGDNSIIELNLYVLIWLMLYVWLMQRKAFSGLRFTLSISEVIFWLFVFSFSISSVIIFENRKIEFEQRKRFAEKLSRQADPSSERILSIALTYLDNDYLAPNFYRFMDARENREFKENIINMNFRAYIKEYDNRIFTFDAATMPLYNEEPVSYDTLNTIYTIQGQKTSIPGLRYYEKSFDRFSYIFRRQVHDKNENTIGYFFILSDPKDYKNDALTPELFKQQREFLPDYSMMYSYAIYNSNLDLIEYYNEYPFSTHLLESQIPKKEFEQVHRGDYEELWCKRPGNKVVIIAKKDNSFIEAITLFAYLFSTFLFLLAFYRLVSFLFRARFRWKLIKQNAQLSIQSQIHSTIILVSLLSFVVIGVATILFFINRYNRTNQERLSRSSQVMEKETLNKLENRGFFRGTPDVYDSLQHERLEKVVQEVSQIHGTDVNLYDTTGNLLVSSNPIIYNKGVLSYKMNPEAFYYLNNLYAVQKIAKEKIGEVEYLSMYSPIRDEQGNAFAYLNIPSYSTQNELKQEISNFLVTIINLNAFIFLVAGVIAFFITNRITASFTLIGEKMRDIKLNKTNQEIEWHRKDEIGELVAEYNKMVNQLEESAGALAKSEREGAWRQMARQVAHEIKNPLTPMKLSIQYLQKAIDNNSPNVKEMTSNVARTLVEQIDHLSKIASDFSQFANIGNPRSEVFDLHEMMYSLVSLYEATDNLQLTWEPVSQRVMLFADKTQLNRLFTNLLQNAVEAGDQEKRRIIHIHEELGHDTVTVSIADNGDGIPEAMRTMIFTPNFTTKSSGTGLGLAMSKSIIEQAKGEIRFDTLEGEGTTFYVTLPLLRAAD